MKLETRHRQQDDDDFYMIATVCLYDTKKVTLPYSMDFVVSRDGDDIV